jgi:hypothetical protein
LNRHDVVRDYAEQQTTKQPSTDRKNIDEKNGIKLERNKR